MSAMIDGVQKMKEPAVDFFADLALGMAALARDMAEMKAERKNDREKTEQLERNVTALSMKTEQLQRTVTALSMKTEQLERTLTAMSTVVADMQKALKPWENLAGAPSGRG